MEIRWTAKTKPTEQDLTNMLPEGYELLGKGGSFEPPETGLMLRGRHPDAFDNDALYGWFGPREINKEFMRKQNHQIFAWKPTSYVSELDTAKLGGQLEKLGRLLQCPDTELQSLLTQAKACGFKLILENDNG